MKKAKKKNLSAMKRARQSIKRREMNRKIKEEIKNLVKKVMKSKSEDDLRITYSVIDKAVKRGVLHKNTAARKKSKLGLIIGIGK